MVIHTQMIPSRGRWGQSAASYTKIVIQTGLFYVIVPLSFIRIMVTSSDTSSGHHMKEQVRVSQKSK